VPWPIHLVVVAIQSSAWPHVASSHPAAVTDIPEFVESFGSTEDHESPFPASLARHVPIPHGWLPSGLNIRE
jgi:hypothetical protein